MFSFTDVKDVVSELALHADSKVLVFMSELLIFYQMITVPGLLAFLQPSFFFNFTGSGPFCFNNELAALK